jgi:hypothetical protein
VDRLSKAELDAIVETIIKPGKKGIPSGKLSHNYGKSPSLIGKSTISMGHFPVRKLLQITRLGISH